MNLSEHADAKSLKINRRGVEFGASAHHCRLAVPKMRIILKIQPSRPVGTSKLISDDKFEFYVKKLALGVNFEPMNPRRRRY